jgi:3-methyladenine DNA glycosylase AlkD
MEEDDYLELASELETLAGATTEEIRTVRRAFSNRLAQASPDCVMAIARSLLERDRFPHRFVAYELIHYHPQTIKSLRQKELEGLGQGMGSWAAVDTFACYLAGPAWREQQVGDQLIASWASSPNRWWRRAALVSTVPLNNKARGGAGDSLRTLFVCRLLVNDRDDMVVKALSWALRELAKRDAPRVAKFLTENGDQLAPRVIREVNHKLTTGRKNPKVLKDKAVDSQ